MRERERLDESSGKILREAGLDFNIIDINVRIISNEIVGYAEYYLHKCISIDMEVYSKLVELDKSVFGTTASKQLYKCLLHTTPSDIIKV